MARPQLLIQQGRDVFAISRIPVTIYSDFRESTLESLHHANVVAFPCETKQIRPFLERRAIPLRCPAT